MNPNDNKSNKFLFDLHNFDTPNEEEQNIVEEEIDLTPPPPTFTEDDLDAAKTMAHSHGHSEGVREERAKREQQIADNLAQISSNFETLFAAEIYRERQYEEESIKLAASIIEQLAPSLNQRFGKDELKNLLKDVMQSQANQSEIRIEVHPDYAGEIDQFIESLWDNNDQAPKCRVVASSEIELGGCSLSWKDGGMIRDPQKMAADMKEAIENLLVDDVLFHPRRKNEGKAGEKPGASVTNPQNNAIKESDDQKSPDDGQNGDV